MKTKKNQTKVKRILGITLIIASIVSIHQFVPFLLLKLFFTPIPDTVPEQMEQMLDYNIEGVIVHIEKQGEEPRNYAVGLKNRQTKEKADAQNLFKIASISKLYMATACAKLIAAGKLSLDDTLAELLPSLKEKVSNAEKITLRMMIEHRSGIVDYVFHPDYAKDGLFDNNKQAIELLYGLEADFEPNEKYAYSNSNYLLLGAIMDSVLGYSHHRYIDTTIIQALGLKHTFNQQSEVDTASLMSGYYEGYQADLKDQNHIHPGGSMIATAEDVAIFLRALNDGSLLNEAEEKVYVYPKEHTGHLPGYISMANYVPEMDAVVVIFMNSSGPIHWSYLRSARRRIMKILKREQ
jgi:CubicO group peptidase (beta-lactamase class C family)